jgi:hypothetical protein
MRDAELTPHELETGILRFMEYLNKMVEENPDFGDCHGAFEQYCLTRYGFGSDATNTRTGKKGDCGIDFFSAKEREYRIGQCKVPELDWLAANVGRARKFGVNAISDIRDSLGYLFGDKKLNANDQVRHLYGLIQSDKSKDGFTFTAFLIVFGRLDTRATEDFRLLRDEYKTQGITIVLQAVDDLVDDFLVGATHANGPIDITIRTEQESVLSSNDYCYFLGNASDIFKAFRDYGWRLFDMNVRYEVRNSPVNSQIVESLRHQSSRKRFHHFNNGIIVVAYNCSCRIIQCSWRRKGGDARTRANCKRPPDCEIHQ